MRSKFALVAFSLFIGATVVACRKDKEELPVITPAGTNITKELGNIGLAETQQALEGKWLLLGTGGGLTGEYHASSTTIYHVFGKTIFTVNDNGKVTENPCSWAKVRSIHSGDSVYQLKWNNGPGMTFLRIINDTLHTSDNAYDGFGNTYLKIK